MITQWTISPWGKKGMSKCCARLPTAQDAFQPTPANTSLATCSLHVVMAKTFRWNIREKIFQLVAGNHAIDSPHWMQSQSLSCLGVYLEDVSVYSTLMPRLFVSWALLIIWGFCSLNKVFGIVFTWHVIESRLYEKRKGCGLLGSPVDWLTETMTVYFREKRLACLVFVLGQWCKFWENELQGCVSVPSLQGLK